MWKTPVLKCMSIKMITVQVQLTMVAKWFWRPSSDMQRWLCGWTEKNESSVWKYSYMENCLVRLRRVGNPSVRKASSTTVIRAGYLQHIIRKHNQSADWPGECHSVRKLITVTILINASKPQSFDLTFQSSLFRIISILNVVCHGFLQFFQEMPTFPMFAYLLSTNILPTHPTVRSLLISVVKQFSSIISYSTDP